MTNSFEPRIYVACLAAYNNGHLHGAWIDVGEDTNEVWDQIKAMLANSPIPDAEEHAIHDYEGFGGVRIEEYDSVETIVRIAGFLKEHGEIGAFVLEHCCIDFDEANEMLERYTGTHSSAAYFAEELTLETTEIPSNLAYYINYEAMARDMQMNGDIVVYQKGYQEHHIFWGY